MAVWSARLGTPLHPELGEFLASVEFDGTLARHDIAGSIAHAMMLGRCGIIPDMMSGELAGGLRRVWAGLKNGQAVLDPELEDIHMNVEKLLEREVGEAALHLHAGRSRNDQVALDMRLYIREAITGCVEALLRLQKVLTDKADANRETVVPGYTHMQQAQPVLLGHILMAHYQRFGRDIERLEQSFGRANVSPLGAGALAGTSLPIDPAMTARLLGFCGPFTNSIDAVSDRDAAAELLFDLSMTMVHLSGLCEEVVLWSTTEFGWMTLGDGTCTGSSIMPQKRNPDVFELARGKSGRVIGDLVSLLVTLKGLPLAYNKDLQEDKPAVFDAVDTALSSIRAVGIALAAAKFHPPAPTGGGLLATDRVEELVKKGVPFRKAHGSVSSAEKERETKGASGKSNGTRMSEMLESVNSRSSPGGTSPAEMARALENARLEMVRTNDKLDGMKAACRTASALLGPADRS